MNKVSETGYYIRTYERDIFITKNQRVVLYEAMEKDKKFFDINDSRIMMSQIKEIIPSIEYRILGKRFCPNHPSNHVPKGKQCGYCMWKA